MERGYNKTVTLVQNCILVVTFVPEYVNNLFLRKRATVRLGTGSEFKSGCAKLARLLNLAL